MKNFAKKLALFLALALTVTMVHPFSVSAASKITLKSGAAAPASVYTGHSYTLKVAGTAVKFYSSNKKVAKVGLTKGALKPVAPGTVKITAKSKKSGKVVATKSFKVLQRATAIKADSDLYLTNVADTATIKATKTPAKSTDVVKFFSADKTIATVGMTSGKVTAKKEGKTIIKVYSLATKATSTKSKYNKVATVNVYVGAVLDTVAQTEVSVIKATFKSDVSAKKFAASDFTVTNNETSVVEAVKEVAVSGKDVKLTMYNVIKDGKAYTVKYGDSSAQFTATDGKVVKLDIVPKTAPVQTATEIKIQELDANGVIVNQYNKTDKPSNVDFDINVTDGYIEGANSVFFNSLNSKAVAKATYHTYVYENGTETGSFTTGDVTIAATNQDTVAADGIQYSVAKTAPDFGAASYRQNTAFPADATDYSVYFKFVKSDKKEIAPEEYAKFTLTTSNNLVFMIDTTLTGNAAKLIPVGEGTANVVVKNAAGTVVATLPITVGKAAVPTSLSFDKTSMTLSNSTDLNETKTVKVTVKDQYGNELTTADALTVEPAKADQTITMEKDGFNVSFSGAGKTAGTYYYTFSYKVDGKDYMKTTYKIVVQNLDKSKAESYAPIITESTVDTTVKEALTADKKVTVKLGHYYGGVLAEEIAVNNDTLKITSIKNSSNVDLAATWYNADNGEITVLKAGDAITKIPAGTYAIALTYSFTVGESDAAKTREAKYTVSLTVTDKQPKAVLAQKKLVIDVMSDEDTVAKEAFGFTYDNKAMADTAWSINKDASTIVKSADGLVFVYKTVAVDVTIADGVVVEIPVTVNKSVSAKALAATAAPAPVTEDPEP